MTTIAAVTRYVDGGLYSIAGTDGTLTKLTVLLSTASTGVYVGPPSMGNGSDFPAEVTGAGDIAGYPITPNQEYTFNLTLIGGSETADNSELCVTTTNTDGAVVSYLVLETF
jgi:hypothetical protein